MLAIVFVSLLVEYTWRLHICGGNRRAYMRVIITHVCYMTLWLLSVWKEDNIKKGEGYICWATFLPQPVHLILTWCISQPAFQLPSYSLEEHSVHSHLCYRSSRSIHLIVMYTVAHRIEMTTSFLTLLYFETTASFISHLYTQFIASIFGCSRPTCFLLK